MWELPSQQREGWGLGFPGLQAQAGPGSWVPQSALIVS